MPDKTEHIRDTSGSADTRAPAVVVVVAVAVGLAASPGMYRDVEMSFLDHSNDDAFEP